ncbi:MAG: glycosyltransferase family 2 protein [Bdellovibrionales bacterium]
MSENPLVSVVIPFFRRQMELQTLLASLMELRKPQAGVEVIVVQDGSEVEDKEVLQQRYSSINLRFISNPKNSGPGFSRNNGSNHARGDYLWFLDTDAVAPNPNVLLEMISVMKTKPKCVAVGGIIEKVGEQDRMLRPIQLPAYHFLFEPVRAKANYEEVVPFLNTTSFFVRRLEFCNAGQFDTSMNMYEDNELGLRLQRHYGGFLYQSSQTMMCHRMSLNGREGGFFTYFNDQSRYLKTKFYCRNLLMQRYSRWRLAVLPALEAYSMAKFIAGYLMGRYHLSRFGAAIKRNPWLMWGRGFTILVQSLIHGFYLLPMPTQLRKKSL